MLARAPELAQLLLRTEARVYVCGDATSLAKDVQTALEQVLERGGGLSEGAARLQVQHWRERRRLVFDVWA